MYYFYMLQNTNGVVLLDDQSPYAENWYTPIDMKNVEERKKYMEKAVQDQFKKV